MWRIVAVVVVLATVVGRTEGQNVFLRSVLTPVGSLNELGNWIQQVERTEFLDCPTNEARFGLACDPGRVSRDDLDNYFCGRSPGEFGWCGAFWQALSGPNFDPADAGGKRGVSNGALPLGADAPADGFQRYSTYLDMFSRVCSCHCGCRTGCMASSVYDVAGRLACGVAPPPGLMIMGVLSGNLVGKTPKFVELYAQIDIPDLSAWGLGSANNGGGTDGVELVLSGSLAAGESLFISYETVSNPVSFVSFMGFPNDISSSVVNVNGDDAIELFKDGVLVDIYGTQTHSGGASGAGAWYHVEGWGYRASGSLASPVFIEADWTFSGPNALLNTELTNDVATFPYPVFSYVPPSN